MFCSNPVGTIHTTETINPQAPVSASFSSPGPNVVTPDILKVCACLMLIVIATFIAQLKMSCGN